MISLNEQIQEVERELDQRRKVYPSLVARGLLRQGIADYQVQRMEAVRATLLWIQRNEAEVRRAFKIVGEAPDTSPSDGEVSP